MCEGRQLAVKVRYHPHDPSLVYTTSSFHSYPSGITHAIALAELDNEVPTVHTMYKLYMVPTTCMQYSLHSLLCEVKLHVNI